MCNLYWKFDSISWDHGDSYLLYHSTNINQIWNKFSFKKGHLEIPSAKWQSFCSRLSMSTILNSAQPDIQMWIITFSDKFFSRSCISSLRSSCFLNSSSSFDCNKKFIVVFAFIKCLSRSLFYIDFKLWICKKFIVVFAFTKCLLRSLF